MSKSEARCSYKPCSYKKKECICHWSHYLFFIFKSQYKHLMYKCTATCVHTALEVLGFSASVPTDRLGISQLRILSLASGNSLNRVTASFCDWRSPYISLYFTSLRAIVFVCSSLIALQTNKCCCVS